MKSRLLNLHANIRQSWKFQAQAYFTVVLIAYVKRFRLHLPFMVDNDYKWVQGTLTEGKSSVQLTSLNQLV
jgi:hypothetical protein